MEKSVIIYGLGDPISGEIRYVGKTLNLNRRYNQHINSARRGKTTRQYRWISSLLEKELYPFVIILEYTTDEKWIEREVFWISFFRSLPLCNLTNHTDGGDGVHNPDKESRIKLSNTRKEMFKDPDFRIKHKLMYSKERNKKISDALKGRKHGWNDKLPQNHSGWHHTKEAVEKIKRNNRGHRWSKEEIEKIRIEKLIGNKYGIGNKSRTGQTRSREERLLTSLSSRGLNRSPETKHRISEAMKRAWKGKRNSVDTSKRLSLAGSGICSSGVIITDSDKFQIVTKYNTGNYTQKELAAEYKISQSLVSKIVKKGINNAINLS